MSVNFDIFLHFSLFDHVQKICSLRNDFDNFHALSPFYIIYCLQQVGPSQERYRTPSCQIQEGNMVNVDVTSPGATLALGMLYFNTQNRQVTKHSLHCYKMEFLCL